MNIPSNLDSPEQSLELTYESFKAWLQGFKSESIVGKRGNPHACPIANWLISKCGLPYVSVSGRGIMLGQYSEPIRLPWVDDFVSLMDDKAPYESDNVTAYIALQDIEEIAENRRGNV